MPIAGPWYITATAIRQYLALLGQPVVKDGPVYRQAAEELQALATLCARKTPQQIADSGAEIYRGPRPRRLRLVVMPSDGEGRAPQLVSVRR